MLLSFVMEEKIKGMRASDVYLMVSGKTYYIALNKLKWRWMYEDEMEEGLAEEERRNVLMETDEVEWYEHFMVPFKAI
jgi:hypothetical protein